MFIYRGVYSKYVQWNMGYNVKRRGDNLSAPNRGLVKFWDAYHWSAVYAHVDGMLSQDHSVMPLKACL